MPYFTKDVAITFSPVEYIVFARALLALFMPMSPRVSSVMWPKQHISSTMLEMGSLDPISLDAAGAISTSWRLVHKILPP